MKVGKIKPITVTTNDHGKTVGYLVGVGLDNTHLIFLPPKMKGEVPCFIFAYEDQADVYFEQGGEHSFMNFNVKEIINMCKRLTKLHDLFSRGKIYK